MPADVTLTPATPSAFAFLTLNGRFAAAPLEGDCGRARKTKTQTICPGFAVASAERPMPPHLLRYLDRRLPDGQRISGGLCALRPIVARGRPLDALVSHHPLLPQLRVKVLEHSAGSVDEQNRLILIEQLVVGVCATLPRLRAGFRASMTLPNERRT